jgi:predicted alpha/beta-fold hydrolase
MALGIKKYFRDNWASFNKMKDPTFNTALQNGLLSTTIAKLDRAVANTMVRNDAFYPFASRIGYKDAEAYWLDASSFRLVRFISVPFLNLTAKDDFLTSTPSRNKLGFCLQNPNVMVVETRCGGHLGWQESPPDTASAFGATSWSDAASADFFDSIIQVNMERNGSSTAEHQTPRVADDYTEYDFKNMMKEDAYVSSRSVHSRL